MVLVIHIPSSFKRRKEKNENKKMKYIRTKHGTIDEVIGETELHWVVKDIPEIKGALLHRSFVVKQADTIKELCDEFVVIGYYKNKPLQFDTLEEAQRFVYENGCQDKDYIGIYGAIWTDKGLIYVAEMNDNEELTLI